MIVNDLNCCHSMATVVTGVLDDRAWRDRCIAWRLGLPDHDRSMCVPCPNERRAFSRETSMEDIIRATFDRQSRISWDRALMLCQKSLIVFCDLVHDLPTEFLSWTITASNFSITRSALSRRECSDITDRVSSCAPDIYGGGRICRRARKVSVGSSLSGVRVIGFVRRCLEEMFGCTTTEDFAIQKVRYTAPEVLKERLESTQDLKLPGDNSLVYCQRFSYTGPKRHEREKALVWGIGVMFHNLVTGKQVFKGARGARELYDSMMRNETPSEEMASLPPFQFKILSQLLAVDAGSRPTLSEALELLTHARLHHLRQSDDLLLRV